VSVYGVIKDVCDGVCSHDGVQGSIGWGRILLGRVAYAQGIFRLINFLIIAFLFVYVFVTYVYPVLKEQIEHYLDMIASYHQSIKAALLRGRHLDVDMKQQRSEAQRLLSSVKQWHAYVDRDLEKKRYELDVRLKNIQRIYRMQEENYRATLLYKRIVPQAFARAADELSVVYSRDKSRADRMLSNILRAVCNHE
jgi:TM2 domain-containing membrane protein YozV